MLSPKDTVAQGILALLRDIPQAMETYREEIKALDKEHAEKLAAHVSADAAKEAVEQEVKAHREKLLAAIDADIDERVKRREAVDAGMQTLLNDRQTVLNDLAEKRAELAAHAGETQRLTHERQVALDAINAQIDAATTKHKTILADIAQVVKQHGGVDA